MIRRTSLRPVDVPPVDKAPPPPLPAPSAETPVDSASTSSRKVLLTALGLVTAGVIVVGWLIAIRPTAPPPQATLATPPTCPSVASFVEVIGSYERQARWGLAATTAQTALRTPGLCAVDRTVLGQKAISLGQEALFEQPPPPEDAPGQRRVASAYGDLKSLASQYGAPPPAPLPIAQSAYDSRLFLLATVAYADAFTNGDSSTQDRDFVRADYAAQYNLGSVWSQRSDPGQRTEGLARLATACRIDETQQLNSPEACMQLQRLVGPRARWPAAAADPLIDATPASSTAHGR